MSSVIQGVASGAVNTTSRSFTLSPTVTGSTIVIEIAIRGSSNSPTAFTVTDNQSNTYVQRKFVANTGVQRAAAIYDCIGATAGVTSVTIVPSAFTGRMMGSIAIQEVANVTVIDQIGQALYTTSPLTVTAAGVDTGTANFVACAIATGSNKTASGISDPPTGYTSAAASQNDNGSTSGGGECCYRINSSAVTDSVSWAVTGGGTANDPGVLASYKATAPAPGTRQGSFLLLGV